MKPVFTSLKIKIIFFVLALIVVSFAVFSFTFVLSEKNRLSEEIMQNGQVFASFSTQIIYDNFVNYYSHNTEEDFINFKKNIEAILQNNKDVMNISLVGINGKILFDSEEFKNGKYNGESRLITDDESLAMINKSETSSRQIVVDGQIVTEIINPLNQSGSHIFSVKYILSHESLADRMKQVYIQIFSVVLPLLLLISLFIVLFVKKITAPLHSLTLAVHKIREGDLASKVEVETKDEIGQLGSAFNDMTRKLKESYTILEDKIEERTKELETERGSLEKKVLERTSELEALKKGLEDMVKERTQKLNDKLEELKKFNAIMIDRELKMIQLKKEIEELKKGHR